MLPCDGRPFVARRLALRAQEDRMQRIQSVASAVIAGAALLAVSVAAAEPIAAGLGQQTVRLGNTPLPVFTYRPTGCADPSLLLVFHGAERNAEDYRDYARGLA